MQRVLRRHGPRLRKSNQRVSRILGGDCSCECRSIPGRARLIKMKAPPRQTQLEFAERLVAGILQPVFRVNSNAWAWSRNELHADPLALDNVAGAERRNAPRPKYGRGRKERR